MRTPHSFRIVGIGRIFTDDGPNKGAQSWPRLGSGPLLITSCSRAPLLRTLRQHSQEPSTPRKSWEPSMRTFMSRVETFSHEEEGNEGTEYSLVLRVDLRHTVTRCRRWRRGSSDRPHVCRRGWPRIGRRRAGRPSGIERLARLAG
jgi:hypothetical protein